MAIDINFGMMKNLLNKNGGAGSTINKEMLLKQIMPFRNAIIFLGVTIFIFASYFKIYYAPMRDENMKKRAEIARLSDLKSKTTTLETQIASLKKKLTASKEQYLESLSHFGNSEDLGDLYQSVSTLAAKYDLIVLNIKEVPLKAATPAAPTTKAAAAVAPSVDKDGKPTAAPKDAAAPAASAAKKDAKSKDSNASKVKEVPVQVELKGKYFAYVQFKEDLAVAEMLLKINSENIKVKNDKDDPGSIYVTLNLSTYAIDKKPFEQAIENEAGK
jgi:Tfp pilus assembly protein PilO